MPVVLKELDKVLEHPPYNFMIHSAPLQEPASYYYHWHIELIPRLTKVAGFEWGSGFYINPTPPEEAARFLREAGLG
jgi:UDPglucose--hexose-1-phosphate uridylyltransferase